MAKRELFIPLYITAIPYITYNGTDVAKMPLGAR